MSHIGNVKAQDGCVLGVSARTSLSMERSTGETLSKPLLQLDAVGSESIALDELSVRELVRLGISWLASLPRPDGPCQREPKPREQGVWKVTSPSAELLVATPGLASKWKDALELDNGFQERVLAYEVHVHDVPPTRDAQGRLVWEKA